MENLEKLPLITVITAVFNGVKTLEKSILSVINQSYVNIEYILIDGGSTDGTIDIIRQYEHRISYWVSEPDGGIYEAWNKGLALASGNWIAFLGADDVYLEGALHAYANYLVEHKNDQLDYVSSRVNLVQDGKLIRTIGKQWGWQVFRRYMNVAHVGSLQCKSLFNKYGVFDTKYKICADYELLLRPRAALKAGFLNVITVSMNVGGASDSYQALNEAERAKIFSGGRNAIICHIEYTLAIVKMCIRKWLWY